MLSSGLAFSHFPCYPQAHWALLLLTPEWVGSVHSRTLWVSPTNSPVRSGVSPAITTPTGFLSQRFEALFTYTGTLGCTVCLAPQLFLPVYLNAIVGPPSLPADDSPGPPAITCPSPPLPLVWMNVSSLTPWLSDFHTVRFSDSSDCFLLLNLLLSLFWLREEAQCIYLHLHLGQKSQSMLNILI